MYQKFDQRWINPDTVLAYFNQIGIECIAQKSSVEGRAINLYRFGNGSKKVMIWSQMHGNESTTTRALVDVMETLIKNRPDKSMFNELQLYIIPVLNPDGAVRWTRNNANEIDLNRDALALSQPESTALFNWIADLKPQYCFNLHDQRTFYNLKNTTTEALLSFLAPATEASRQVNELRLKSMEIINHIVKNSSYSDYIGRYYDDFNPQCFGDRLGMLGYPTLLFEAGQLGLDYARTTTRKAMAEAILEGLTFIAENDFPVDKSQTINRYQSISEMDKAKCDVLIKLVRKGETLSELEIDYQEQLKDDHISFIPVVKNIIPTSEKTARKTVVLVSNKTLLRLKVGDTMPNLPELKF
ncbi:MAG: M14 family zinc carboxypeptidase [Flavobacteriaceae bacterium]|nr:M14 family zinc carboxypeptidase [Flavobacteriaceae bacterium]